MTPLRLALLGRNVSYTLSPRIFEVIFELDKTPGSFDIVDLPPERLSEGLRELKSRQGFAVTIPYKEAIVPYLDDMSELARNIRAVNSVKVEGHRLIGHNTDVEGFLRPLIESDQSFRNILILGHGGVARAALFALRERFPGAEISICGRSLPRASAFVESVAHWPGERDVLRAITFEEIASDGEFDLIVNCTPLGSATHMDLSPLTESFRFRGCVLCYDLVYRPPETKLLAAARRHGVATGNGLSMLVWQALASYIYWTGRPLDMNRTAEAIMATLSLEARR